MNLVFFSKGKVSVQKTAKTKVVQKNANWRSSETKGKGNRSRIGEESQRRFFNHILIFLLSNAKIFTIKAFLEVSLLSLTLRACTVV